LNKYVKELVTLSDTDKKLDSFIPRIDAVQSKIDKEQKRVDSVETKIDALKKHIEENESKISTYEEQIKALGDQLQSIQRKTAEISTEKEMKALSLEEEIAKEKMTFANEEIARLDKANSIKKEDLQELEEKVVELREAVERVKEESKEELENIEKEKEILYKEREQIVIKMDQKILSFYEKIRKWAGNTAVVQVKKQACYGCYLKISDKTYSDVIRGEEIVTCPHCGRILYLEEAINQQA